MAVSSWAFFIKKHNAMRNYRAAEKRRMAGEKVKLNELYAQYDDVKSRYMDAPAGSMEKKGLEFEKDGLFNRILDLETSSTTYTDNNKSDFLLLLESYTHKKTQYDSDFSFT